MQIEQTVAFVTGGASGLGEATARAILSGGGQVLIADRDATRGENLAQQLGARALFVATDVSDEASVLAARDAAMERFGKLTAAVNCAGIAIASKTVGKDGPHSLADFQRVIDVNLAGSFNVARLCAEVMQANAPDEDGQRGVIVNTASVAAFDGQKGQPAYAASKGGVAAMTLPMARDLAGQGIRVMAIAPGLFLTPMLEGLPEAAREALASQPLFPQRLGRPAEFGKLVRTIIELPYLNASVIRLDAGIRMP